MQCYSKILTAAVAMLFGNSFSIIGVGGISASISAQTNGFVYAAVHDQHQTVHGQQEQNDGISQDAQVTKNVKEMSLLNNSNKRKLQQQQCSVCYSNLYSGCGDGYVVNPIAYGRYYKYGESPETCEEEVCCSDVFLANFYCCTEYVPALTTYPPVLTPTIPAVAPVPYYQPVPTQTIKMTVQKSSNTGRTVGITVSMLFLIGVIAVLAFLYRREKNKNAEAMSNNNANATANNANGNINNGVELSASVALPVPSIFGTTSSWTIGGRMSLPGKRQSTGKVDPGNLPTSNDSSCKDTDKEENLSTSTSKQNGNASDTKVNHINKRPTKVDVDIELEMPTENDDYDEEEATIGIGINDKEIIMEIPIVDPEQVIIPNGGNFDEQQQLVTEPTGLVDETIFAEGSDLVTGIGEEEIIVPADPAQLVEGIDTSGFVAGISGLFGFTTQPPETSV